MHENSMLRVVAYLACATALWHGPAAGAADASK